MAEKLYPDCIWNMPNNEKVLYLSFDDGPHPSITPFVLNELSKYQASASFFCIGDNVDKFPETFERVKQSGHTIGNHTQQHVNGWKTTDDFYIDNILRANQSIGSNLFRPPYGRIKKSQIKLLKTRIPEMKIIMWNILAGDWDATVAPAICFERMKNKIQSGDIIVFHDSEKAAPRMQVALPQLLEHFANQGYQFKKIEC
jgi:peptidoglycan/xylan/chitin deacetylase (PgdA/CDA1 family)